ncbi:hypothetical protein, partial [Staphylococcus aureus]|uniref:hypothetical protein n=1 Tax=Staphylococcus aureus TaxID=1280 RepID=UPI00301E2A95
MALLHPLKTLLHAPMTRLIAAWVRPRLIEPEPTELGLVPDLPVLYVLPRPALSDASLLAALTERHALPRAAGRRRIGALRPPACLALPATRRRL